MDDLNGLAFIKLVAEGGAMVLLAGHLFMQFILILRLGPQMLAWGNSLVARLAAVEAKIDGRNKLDSITTGQHEAVSVAQAEALTNGKKQ